LMPGRAEQAMADIVAAHDAGIQDSATEPAALPWSDAASDLLAEISDPSLRDNIRLRAEKKARREHAQEVSSAHIAGFLDGVPEIPNAESEKQATGDTGQLYWETEALARLARVPAGFMRDASRQRIEDHARLQNADTVTLDIAEGGLKLAREAMTNEMAKGRGNDTEAGAPASKCPFASMVNTSSNEQVTGSTIPWTGAATARLREVPAGYCRRLTQRAVETLARQNNLQQIDVEFMQGVLKVFKQGSQTAQTSMPWTQGARDRIARAPDSVRGMLQKEIEGWAKNHGLDEVDERAVVAVKREWQAKGVFHLDPADPRGEA